MVAAKKEDPEIKAASAENVSTIAELVLKLGERLEKLEKGSNSHRGKGRGGNNSRGRSRGGSFGGHTCFTCGRRGHMSYECFSNQNSGGNFWRGSNRGGFRGKPRGGGRGNYQGGNYYNGGGNQYSGNQQGNNQHSGNNNNCCNNNQSNNNRSQ